MTEHTPTECPRASALEERMNTMQESAERMEQAFTAMVTKHDKSMGWVTKTFIGVLIAGAAGIGGVYVFSTQRADAALEKANGVQQASATTDYHDTSQAQALTAFKNHHDELAVKDQQLVLQAIDNITPAHKKIRRGEP